MVTVREFMQRALEESSKNDLSTFFAKENLFKIGGRLLTGCVYIVLLVFFGVVSWRIAWSNWNVDLSKFEFSDLLALIMGLFAVAMSVAFYFKATDTSNKFYDNVYKFTQETSEILGRIEAGFGERLRHLDEGYSGLQTRFDRFSNITPEESKKRVEETKEKETEEKAKLEKAKEEMQAALKNLTHKAYSQERERHEFMEKLGSLQAEKDMAEAALRELKEERDRLQEEMHLLKRNMFEDMSELEAYLMNNLDLAHILVKSVDAPFQISRRKFSGYLERVPENVLVQFQKQGIISETGELTLEGYDLLRNISRRLRKYYKS
ncbi:MAG TPA: hypothetical protein VMX13_01420 [Sedimentisphaerales bacterium]|nr:hypothetical protein [Sedimentisphaerales bacterium]